MGCRPRQIPSPPGGPTVYDTAETPPARHLGSEMGAVKRAYPIFGTASPWRRFFSFIMSIEGGSANLYVCKRTRGNIAHHIIPIISHNQFIIDQLLFSELNLPRAILDRATPEPHPHPHSSPTGTWSPAQAQRYRRL